MGDELTNPPAITASPETAAVSSEVASSVVETSAPEQIESPPEPKEKSLLGSAPEPADGTESPKEEPPLESEGEESPDLEGEQPEEKKEEASQSEEAAPLPTYEPFTLPDDIQLDENTLGEFTQTLAEFETLTKADHAEVQKFGQELVTRHIAEVQNAVQRLNESYAATWEKQKNDWKESFVNDPEIGGNRQETTISSALEFIRTHGGTDAHQADFRKLMDETGIGNHPAMIRILANAMEAKREGKPLPASQPIPSQRSKVNTRYGKM